MRFRATTAREEVFFVYDASVSPCLHCGFALHVSFAHWPAMMSEAVDLESKTDLHTHTHTALRVMVLYNFYHVIID